MSLFRTAHCGLDSYLTQCECSTSDEVNNQFNGGFGQHLATCARYAGVYSNNVNASGIKAGQGTVTVRETSIRFPVSLNSSHSYESSSSGNLSSKLSDNYSFTSNSANPMDEMEMSSMMLRGNRNSLLHILSTSYQSQDCDYDLVHGTVNSLVQSDLLNRRTSMHNDYTAPSQSLPFSSTAVAAQNRFERTVQQTGAQTRRKSSKTNTNEGDQVTKTRCSAIQKKRSSIKSNLSELERSRYATRFTTEQNKILNEWYVQNETMPYASDERVAELAVITQLSEKSVRKWLSNKRSRKRNTNTLGSVVAFKKKKLENYADDKCIGRNWNISESGISSDVSTTSPLSFNLGGNDVQSFI